MTRLQAAHRSSNQFAPTAAGSSEAFWDGLDQVAGVLLRPRMAARSLAAHPRWAVALGVLALTTAVVGSARTSLTLEAVSSLGQTQLGSSSLIAVSRLFALVVGPLGQAVKLLVVAFLFWAGLLFVRDIEYRRVFSAIVHAELPLVMGAALHTLFLYTRRGEIRPEDIEFSLGLNLVVPGVDVLSTAGVVLTRINPFFVWWGVFLYVWLRRTTGLSRLGSTAFVGAYWALFTGLLVALRLIATP